MAAVANPGVELVEVAGGTGIGHTTLQLCSLGTFKAAAGQTTCKRCPAGTFASKHGSVNCRPCPKGTQAIAGHSACGAVLLACTATLPSGVGLDRCLGLHEASLMSEATHTQAAATLVLLAQLTAVVPQLIS